LIENQNNQLSKLLIYLPRDLMRKIYEDENLSSQHVQKSDRKCQTTGASKGRASNKEN